MWISLNLCYPCNCHFVVNININIDINIDGYFNCYFAFNERICFDLSWSTLVLNSVNISKLTRILSQLLFR